MAFRRLFGLTLDDNDGGSTYDEMVAITGSDPDALVPDPDIFLPVTTAQVDRQENPLERAAEVTGGRGARSPIEFSANPAVTFTDIAYPSIVKLIAKLGLGGTDTPLGTPPASILHSLKSTKTGPLPAAHATVIRDDQHDRVAGCTVDQFTLSFPLAEWGTVEANLRGKYAEYRTADEADALITAADFSDLPRRGYLLRDAAAFIDGSETPFTELIRQFSLTFDNNLRDPKWFQKRNRRFETGDDDVRRCIWWPERHDLGEQNPTGEIQFGQVEPDEDLKRLLARAQEFVFEVEFEPLDTTPSATELLRITVHNQVYTGGGAEPLTRSDDIQSSYNFGCFLDDNNEDVTFEFVDDSSAAL